MKKAGIAAGIGLAVTILELSIRHWWVKNSSAGVEDQTHSLQTVRGIANLIKCLGVLAV